MRRKFRYAFASRRETEGGFISMIYAGCCLALFVISALISFVFAGNAARWVGALGVMAFLFSVCGFVSGLRSFREKDKHYYFSAIGSLANGIFLVGWLALFLYGLGG